MWLLRGVSSVCRADPLDSPRALVRVLVILFFAWRTACVAESGSEVLVVPPAQEVRPLAMLVFFLDGFGQIGTEVAAAGVIWNMGR